MDQATQADLLDEAIDYFEDSWSESSVDQLPDLLRRFGLSVDPTCLAELIRVDIQRRYAVGAPLMVTDYVARYPQLASDSESLRAIDYEDSRTRARGDQGSHGGNNRESLRTNDLLVAASDDCRDVSVAHSAIEAVRQMGFTVVRLIGRGAFSEVFLARQSELSNRHVVLKVVERTLSEPQRLARLQHTNIVPIFSFHQSGNRSILCMPYEGTVTLADFLASDVHASLRTGESLVSTLRQQIDQTLVQSVAESSEQHRANTTPLGPEVLPSPLQRLAAMRGERLALWIFCRLAGALSHSHARGILHGDLKPANVLIRSDGEPALLDFNLSREIGEQATSWFGGTLPYMSPEVLRALMQHRVESDARSDIYALGIMLYEMLTGRLPYLAPISTAPLDLNDAAETRFRPLAWRADDRVAASVRAIIQSCLQPIAEHRYQSAEHLFQDLESELDNRPLRYAGEPSLASRTAKWMRRHPTLSSATALTCSGIATLVLVGVSAWQLRESNRSLFATAQREEFSARSSHVLSKLLPIADFYPGSSLDAADRCLGMYQVLDNPNWKVEDAYAYLDEDDKVFVKRRITHLLLVACHWRLSTNESGIVRSATTDNQIHTYVHAIADPSLFRTAPYASSRLITMAGYEDLLPHQLNAQNEKLTGEHPVDTFAQALSLLEDSKASEALELLSPDLLRDIDTTSYWVTVGRAQMKTNQLRPAELSFTLAIKNDDAAEVAYLYRGICRLQMRTEGASESAAIDFEKVLSLASDVQLARINLALAREAIGDLQGAVEVLDEALKHGRKTTGIMLARSRLHRKLRNPEQSTRDLREVMKLTPQSVDEWVSRAFARMSFDKTGALDDLRQAEKLDPASTMVLQTQAHLLSELLERPDEALACLDRLLRYEPSFEKALLGRAVLYARQGKVARAINDIENAKRQHRQLTPASLYQAACVHAILIGQSDASSVDHRRLSLAYLSSAIQRGYGSDLLSTDGDLNNLRDNDTFRQIEAIVRLADEMHTIISLTTTNGLKVPSP